MAANNMISYSQHIWNDMRNIIQMIIDEHGKDFAVEVVREGRRCRQDPEYVAKLLSEISDDISEFINRTNRNRPAFIRKLTKECSLKEQQIAWFYALVLISMHQVSLSKCVTCTVTSSLQAKAIASPPQRFLVC